MRFYFESSALAKLYVQERGTGWVRRLVEHASPMSLVFSQIAPVEVVSALRRRFDQGSVTRDDYDRACTALIELARRKTNVILTTPQIAEKGIELVRKHGLRTYDAIHLATACVLTDALRGHGLPRLKFVSSDRALCEAAKKEGFEVIDPESMNDADPQDPTA